MSLLASFMKLNTKMQIDRKQYQLTCVSIEYNRVQDQIQSLTEADDMAKSAFESIKSSLASISASVFTTTQSAAQSTVDAKNKAYTDAYTAAAAKKVPDPTKDATVIAAAADRDKAIEDFKNQAAGAAQLQQAEQIGLANFSNGVNSVFAASNKVQQDCLHRQEKSLDLQKGNLETQLKGLNSQYDAYEKLEDADAKKMAPNFGISG